MITKLLHIANSDPDAVDRQRFYAMKDRILRRWAEPDGWDVQCIPGKICYGCDGSGTYYGYHSYSGDEWEDDCRRCYGTGWYKSPKWITLYRFRFGRFTFHVPGEVHYHKPHDSLFAGAAKRIDGYVRHRHYGYRWPYWACVALGVLFDWKLAWTAIRAIWGRWWLVRAWKRRCYHCRRHVWSTTALKCGRCKVREAAELPEASDEQPF